MELLAMCRECDQSDSSSEVSGDFLGPPQQSRPNDSTSEIRRHRVYLCAVDPKKIPYGSKVVFPDATCVAVDTGSAVVNRKAARLSGRTRTE
jgi:hypothetical protein